MPHSPTRVLDEDTVGDDFDYNTVSSD